MFFPLASNTSKTNFLSEFNWDNHENCSICQSPNLDRVNVGKNFFNPLRSPTPWGRGSESRLTYLILDGNGVKAMPKSIPEPNPGSFKKKNNEKPNGANQKRTLKN